MKSFLIAALAVMCVLGLATANFGYYPAATGSSGQSPLMMLLMVFFLFFILNNSSSSTGGTVTIVNGSASG
ncbi:hypothetical protein ACF0H5_018191 [Mactra antiquata]